MKTRVPNLFVRLVGKGDLLETCRGQGMDDYIAPGDRDTWLCAAEAPRDLAEKIARFAATRPRQALAAPLYFSDLIPGYLKALEQ